MCIVSFRLQPERRVLMSDVRLPPTSVDAAPVPVKEEDEIEVSKTTDLLWRPLRSLNCTVSHSII